MRSFRIGRLFGIPLELDLTFLLVLPIFAWLIGSEVGQWVGILNRLWTVNLDAAALTTGAIPWILGLAAALGLFAGIVLHELGHSLVAAHFGFPIESITLWVLGGIAKLTEQPEDWRQELYIALAGPGVSVLLGGLFFGVLFVIPSDFHVLRFLAGYLSLVNVAIAGFNLLPGFPMDGGRVLRAVLARNRPFARATQLATKVGKAMAIIMGILGLFSLNFFLIAIAFFIYIGASSEAQRTTLKAIFEGVSVGDVMTEAESVHTVSPDQTVEELLDRMFRERHTGYPVIEDDQVVGMVTLDDAREVPAVEREAYLVSDIMSTDLQTIPEYSDVSDALDRMQQAGIGRLIVVDAQGNLTGLLSRTDLMTAFEIMKERGGITGESSPEERLDNID
ncbi:MAG: CBS domain-containing protein [Halodesulfurarchaeum sp.]